MKYYRINGNVTAYEADGSQDAYIPAHAVAMSAEEVEAHINPPKTEADLVAAIKARRDQAISGGTVVNGMPIKTDLESRNLIAGAHLYVQANPEATIMFAVGGSHIELTAGQVSAIALAVGSHVQACYRVEAEKISALKAGEPYNIEDGWPGHD